MAHVRVALEIARFDWKEEDEEVVCLSESWQDLNMDPASVPVAEEVLAKLEVPVELVADWVEVLLRGLAWHTVSVSIPVCLLAILSE